MSPRNRLAFDRRVVVTAVGVALVAGGLLVAIVSGEATQPTPSVTVTVAIVALLAFAGACWKVRGRLTDPDRGTVPWAPAEALVAPAPERTTRSEPHSGASLSALQQRAGRRARRGRSVDAGLEVVRPALVEVLTRTLARSGESPTSVHRRIDEGSWTDNSMAASALSSSVPPPDRPFSTRIRDWLVPERAVRERTAIAVQAIAEVADEELSTIPGQRVPRSVPELRPRLSELHRDVDGRLQRAVDPDAVRRGPGPVESSIEPPRVVRAEERRSGAATAKQAADDRTPVAADESDGPAEPATSLTGLGDSVREPDRAPVDDWAEPARWERQRADGPANADRSAGMDVSDDEVEQGTERRDDADREGFGQ